MKKENQVTVTVNSDRVPLMAQEASNLIAVANGVNVKTDSGLGKAGDRVREWGERKKEAEKLRRELVDPLNQHVKKINGLFKTVTGPIDEAVGIVRGKMGAYVTKREDDRRKEEAAARSAEDAADEERFEDPVPVREAPVRGRGGSTTITKKVWAVEVVDITKVPAKYLLVETSAVLADIRALAADRKPEDLERAIPGIRAFQKDQVTVR
jgi:hypothetical protein